MQKAAVKVSIPGNEVIQQIIDCVIDDISKFPVTNKTREHLAALIVNEISRRLGNEIKISMDAESLGNGFLR
ncbi:hypothetical protein MLB55_003885 [Salmonella enterica]|nr:hypothetical protein [Salmonella enterica]ECB7109446.1 hypothetical protein [Salmonella enterica subsp. enterica serovar Newport]ECG3782398.1 hypothetical protein [Salmonella enterica subsp. enterica serovar Florida]EKQ9927186.1 hypothetical protein [Salmonella enterica subsp. enterica serovar Panama]EAW2931222.1 hypothetical protein [Salmonella enterica]ECF2112039.1 hypothetical protein [Salmonella enterica subsp. enterica serovar Newport]